MHARVYRVPSHRVAIPARLRARTPIRSASISVQQTRSVLKVLIHATRCRQSVPYRMSAATARVTRIEIVDQTSFARSNIFLLASIASLDMVFVVIRPNAVDSVELDDPRPPKGGRGFCVLKAPEARYKRRFLLDDGLVRHTHAMCTNVSLMTGSDSPSRHFPSMTAQSRHAHARRALSHRIRPPIPQHLDRCPTFGTRARGRRGFSHWR